MIWTLHIILGAALASRINPLPLGLSLAFFSHFFLDFLPHWEYSTKNITYCRWRKSVPDFLKIALDGSLGFLIIIVLSKNLFLSLGGGILAISPDWLTLLAFILPQNALLKKQYRLHPQANHYFKNKKIPKSLGILAPLIIFIFSLWLLSV